MTDQDFPSPYAPPKAPLDGPPDSSKRPETVGYLIGAILQIAVGALIGFRAFYTSVFMATVPFLEGVFLIVRGVVAVGRYRRSRRERNPG